MTDDILRHGEQLLDSLNRQEFERAQARIASAPLTLTDHDFVVLTNYGGEGEAARAYEARRLAQLAIVRQCGGCQSSTTPSAPLETKSLEAPAQTSSSLAKHFDAFGDVIIDIIKRTVEPMKAHIAALQEQNKALSDRVLELEAQRAATSKVDV